MAQSKLLTFPHPKQALFFFLYSCWCFLLLYISLASPIVSSLKIFNSSLRPGQPPHLRFPSSALHSSRSPLDMALNNHPSAPRPAGAPRNTRLSRSPPAWPLLRHHPLTSSPPSPWLPPPSRPSQCTFLPQAGPTCFVHLQQSLLTGAPTACHTCCSLTTTGLESSAFFTFIFFV